MTRTLSIEIWLLPTSSSLLMRKSSLLASNMLLGFQENSTSKVQLNILYILCVICSFFNFLMFQICVCWVYTILIDLIWLVWCILSVLACYYVFPCDLDLLIYGSLSKGYFIQNCFYPRKTVYICSHPLHTLTEEEKIQPFSMIFFLNTIVSCCSLWKD